MASLGQASSQGAAAVTIPLTAPGEHEYLYLPCHPPLSCLVELSSVQRTSVCYPSVAAAMANQPFPAPKETVFALSICCSLEWRILHFFLNEFSQAVPVQQIHERKGSSAPWPDHGKQFCSPAGESRVQPPHGNRVILCWVNWCLQS